MKNLLPNDKKPILLPYVTSYTIDGDKILINCSNYPKPIEVEYSVEEEKDLLEVMKQQAKDAIEYQNSYRKDIDHNVLHFLSNGALTLTSAIILLDNLDNKMKYIGMLGIITGAFASTFAAVIGKSDKKKLEELIKYEYFLNNESIINDDIIDKYHEMYGENAPINEANLISFNNIDEYTLDDLKERVRNIVSSEDYILSLARK